MKKFLKKALLLAFFLLASSSTFADDFNGDIQLVLGHEKQYMTIDDGAFRWKSNNFDIGLKNAGFYELASFFGLGYMLGCDLTIGKSIYAENSRTHDDFDFLLGFDTFLGPAISIKIPQVLTLQGGIGFAWQYMAMFGDIDAEGLIRKSVDYNIYEKSSGFGFDIQAKLFPISPLSAVFGLKGIFTGNTKYRLSIDGHSDTIDDDIDLNCFKFYAGGSLNF